jgi:hypothetical protein
MFRFRSVLAEDKFHQPVVIRLPRSARRLGSVTQFVRWNQVLLVLVDRSPGHHDSGEPCHAPMDGVSVRNPNDSRDADTTLAPL